MYRTLIAAALVVASSFAQAQAYYQRAALAQQTCKAVADAGVRAYQARQTGQAHQSWATTGTLGSIVRWAEDYGERLATDERQAARIGFAKCLDNFDLMHQDMRAGRTTPVGELN